MEVEVWSDVICPWCYLGKARLDAAISQLDWGDEISIRWRAYQLDPRATSEPRDLRASIERKYGPGAYEGMQRRLDPLAAEAGITYRWDQMQRVNTLDAHRLLAWAYDTAGAEVQGELGQRLFRAYFTDGDNVADHGRLVAMAGEVGLDRDEASAVLSEDRYADEVAADLDEALELGLTGVPAFVIARKALIPGAQDVETIRLILERTKKKLAAAG
jgi:predicted DsbA family dithiol-disulfide isomerase